MLLDFRSISIITLFFSLLSAHGAAQDSQLFPRPPELEPAVRFWTRVYTEVDTQSGFLHDARNLAVVYDRMPLDRRQIENRRNQIQTDLRVLAGGKRSGLSEGQRQILSLWPEDVSNDVLREAVDNVRFQLGQSDRFLGGLRRSGAYRQHIDAVIREKGLPAELAVLPHVESSFNPNAYSSAAAAGMWQFGRATGQRFMRIDHIVDERMDPYIASNAAMSLLEYNHSVLGTWPLALTAYNHGAGGIARAVRETGTTDIETIVANYRGRAFGFASRNFYAQFLAVLDVENRASDYFGDVNFDPAPVFRTVVTDAFIDAEIFARSVGISLEQLQADNRALRPAVWEGNKRIPRGFPVKLREGVVAEENVLALISDDYKFAVQTPDVAYVVERGDSLSVIARRFNTTVGRLVALNQLRSRNRIQIGQRLLLPQDNAVADQTLGELAAQDGQYTVRRGDTISVIASRFGVSEQQVLSLNGIADRNRIYPGQNLQLPGFEDQSRATAANEPDRPPEPESERAAAEGLAQVTEEEIPVASRNPEAEADTISAVPALEPVMDLALVEELLPPAAVLPDNAALDSEVTAADEIAEAIDPAVDVAEANQQLVEDLSADPSDYSVSRDNTIEIQASETLGHYADWLGIRAWDIRRLNNMAFRDPVIIGNRLRLDFSKVNIAEFERARREFHSTLQQEFFASYRIQNVETYEVRRGDNISTIARRRYSSPIWLVRQYNPELDFNRIQIGQPIVFPLLERVD
ncbi:MAG: LysM peptidoglycan-binding domain-containing protein [Pseudohongiellaceae bacterium]|jgi:membrane-bound lytic murein transglycosylase D|nr:LysM peptidoglycan-binding domain-containing protein [Gammaproteobacteria bacterium]